MKKSKQIIYRCLAVLLTVMMFASSMVISDPTPVNAASKVSLTSQSGKVAIGGTTKIKIKNAPKKAEITYKSSNPSVAKVSKKGVVTGVAVGSTKIKINVKKGSKSTNLVFKVTVKKPSVKKASYTVMKGQSVNLEIKYKPSKAKYTWKSANKKIAKVNSKGKVTGVKPGKTKITVNIKKGKKTYKLTYKVEVTSDVPKDGEWAEGDLEEKVHVYSIADLKINPAEGKASAIVSAPDTCALVVRFMSEETYFSKSETKYYIDEDYLYASKPIAAQTDMSSVDAVINGSLPEHFVAEAVLIDENKNKLCNAYYDIDHTVRHEQFEKKTVYDFGKDQVVLNFDKSKNNNFGVLNKNVKVLSASSVETVYGKNIEDKKYVIKGASKKIKAGDKIFVTDKKSSLLFRAAKVSGSKKKYEITPARVNNKKYGYGMNEFYDFLKVDMGKSEYSYGNSSISESDADTTTVIMDADAFDQSNEEVNITEISEGLGSEVSAVTISKKIEFKTKDYDAAGQVSTKIKVDVEMEYDFNLFGDDYFKCNCIITNDTTTTFYVTGKVDNADSKLNKELSLGKLVIPIGIPGVDIFAEAGLEINWKLSAGIYLEGSSKTTSGFKYNTMDGYQEIDKKENNWRINAKGHAEIEFGPKVSVGIEFLLGVAKAKVSLMGGAKAEANAVIPVAEVGDSRHACSLCINGTIKAFIKVSASLESDLAKLFGGKFVIFEKSRTDEAKLFDFYVSLINDKNSMFHGKSQGGEGSCPNKEYKTKFIAKNMSGAEIGADVTVVRIDSGKTVGQVKTTDSGIYLSPGQYKAKAVIDGHNSEKTFSITDRARSVTLSAQSGESGIMGGVVEAITNSAIEGAKVEVYDYTTLITSVNTDAMGRFNIPAEEGTYKVLISKDGYIPNIVYASVGDGEKVSVGSITLAKLDQNAIMGGLYGTIKDAISGEGIENAKIRLSRGKDNTVTNTYVAEFMTDSYGYFTRERTKIFGIDFGLVAGNYTATISKDGYITRTANITITGGEDTEFNITISPVGSENVYRIVLTWGQTPEDLDSHLRSEYNGDVEHVYFSHMNGGASYLDTDDTTSYGPETITIKDISVFSKPIQYSVHDYTNKGSDKSFELSYSNAVVEVYKGAETIKTFYVPSGNEGTVWRVFELSPDGSIVTKNSFEYISDEYDVSGESDLTGDFEGKSEEKPKEKYEEKADGKSNEKYEETAEDKTEVKFDEMSETTK